MDRTYPYEPDAYCDDCGHQGAYDLMGEYLCAKCLEDHREDFVDLDDMDDWSDED